MMSEDLRAELESGLRFMYPWTIDDQRVDLMDPELGSIHATRGSLIEAPVRAALARGGRVLDVGAHEGWFSQRALAWGADSVLAVDVRDVNVRRARLLRDYHEIPAERLEVRKGDVYELDPSELGEFDVVLVLGLIYHLENPVGALRTAARLAGPGALVVVESQLTRAGPMRVGWGLSGQFSDEPASWASRLEPADDQEHQPLAAFGGVISLVPNRLALAQAMEAAGLSQVAFLEPAAEHNEQYRLGDRAVAVGIR
jgi:SAM-dependent methyltransferase